LFLSLATVKSHLTASMRRLGVRSRTQLAIMVNRDSSPAL
jgi:DNA-binding NarL/FixJ family response regulator